ncbi:MULTISPECIES: IniB N-terminal domain-containing protein [Actinoplanes]|uniref:Uncharacterized protein n=2 Tax=Actinoplanes TaxID=1865 RepID=A0A101JEX0_9ACTN|nr:MULTISPECIES: IniB N-terminal domain-containing protein [Actinoplanes]KUL25499.1 hypothetical protein ADL15_40555 [Actinoplanes awajinensis subsp. mycoplanecinus]GIE70232.1 hypothetical protein Apa02nite_063400 [Actinoplanes palleronii]
MDSFPTLQEFVLHLIYDPAARSAFELDPELALQAAGLDDITAADVQQVIPLVIDSAPVAGLHGLTGADDLSTGVANLDVAGAVSHLQAIAAQVTLTPAHLGAELNAGFGGAAAISVAGTSVGAGSAFTLTGIGGFSAADDPGQHVDQHVVAPVEHAVTGVLPGAVLPAPDHGAVLPGLDSGPAGLLDSGLDTIGDVPSSAGLDHFPGLDGPGLGGATSSIESVLDPDLGHVLSQDPADTVHGAVSGVTGTVGGVLHDVTPPLGETTHGLLGDLHF